MCGWCAENLPASTAVTLINAVVRHPMIRNKQLVRWRFELRWLDALLLMKRMLLLFQERARHIKGTVTVTVVSGLVFKSEVLLGTGTLDLVRT